MPSQVLIEASLPQIGNPRRARLLNGGLDFSWENDPTRQSVPGFVVIGLVVAAVIIVAGFMIATGVAMNMMTDIQANLGEMSKKLDEMPKILNEMIKKQDEMIKKLDVKWG